MTLDFPFARKSALGREGKGRIKGCDDGGLRMRE